MAPAGLCLVFTTPCDDVWPSSRTKSSAIQVVLAVLVLVLVLVLVQVLAPMSGFSVLINLLVAFVAGERQSMWARGRPPL